MKHAYIALHALGYFL